MVAVTVAVACGDVRTSALVDLAWTVAHAASVELANAVVDVITDAVGIGVRGAVTTTHAQGVELVAVAVAVACRDAVTAAHTALVGVLARAVIGVGIHVVVAR